MAKRRKKRTLGSSATTWTSPCKRAPLARKIREIRAMPVASKMRPLRQHLLRLAASSAKHGYCQRAGIELRKARRISEETPDDVSYARAVRRAQGR